jgi:hypothetical protein
MFWKKLKLTISSERTLALLGFVAVTIANSVFKLHLDVPPLDGGPSALTLIGGSVAVFTVGKSMRPTTPHDEAL